MKAFARFREAFFLARRQQKFEAAFRHLMALTPDDLYAAATTARAMSKLFAEYGTPEAWDGHLWRRSDAKEATMMCFRRWSAGEWTFVSGAVPPPAQEPHAVHLPMIKMVQ
jgi:hypothetical protein